jgi:hypothetical protein
VGAATIDPKAREVRSFMVRAERFTISRHRPR